MKPYIRLTPYWKKFYIRQFQLGKVESFITYTKDLELGYCRDRGKNLIRVMRWGDLYIVDSAKGYRSKKFYEALHFEGVI